MSSAARRRARVDERGRPFILTGPRDTDPDVSSRRLVREAGLYDVHEEVWELGTRGRPGDTLTSRIARNKSGDYIGDERDAKFLCDQLGIAPVRADDGHSVCSYGYSEAKGKWFGWSHRAIHGFREGHKVSTGSVVSTEHAAEGRGFQPGHVLRTDEEARRAAMLFASEVS